jgi:hypothetical protein
MTVDWARRRILGAAAVLAATTGIASLLRPGRAGSQSINPQDALARVFSADQLDPTWFDPTLLKRVSLQQLQLSFTGFKGLFGTFQTVAIGGNDRYVVQCTGGSVQLSATFDGYMRITSLVVLDVSYALADDEQELQFTSGSDTVYGTLLVPPGATVAPAALLIAGSGPTDRNGNGSSVT